VRASSTTSFRRFGVEFLLFGLAGVFLVHQAAALTAMNGARFESGGPRVFAAEQATLVFHSLARHGDIALRKRGRRSNPFARVDRGENRVVVLPDVEQLAGVKGEAAGGASAGHSRGKVEGDAIRVEGQGETGRQAEATAAASMLPCVVGMIEVRGRRYAILRAPNREGYLLLEPGGRSREFELTVVAVHAEEVILRDERTGQRTVLRSLVEKAGKREAERETQEAEGAAR
jgi:hypothetical protein